MVVVSSILGSDTAKYDGSVEVWQMTLWRWINIEKKINLYKISSSHRQQNQKTIPGY